MATRLFIILALVWATCPVHAKTGDEILRDWRTRAGQAIDSSLKGYTKTVTRPQVNYGTSSYQNNNYSNTNGQTGNQPRQQLVQTPAYVTQSAPYEVADYSKKVLATTDIIRRMNELPSTFEVSDIKTTLTTAATELKAQGLEQMAAFSEASDIPDDLKVTRQHGDEKKEEPISKAALLKEAINSGATDMIGRFTQLGDGQDKDARQAEQQARADADQANANKLANANAANAAGQPSDSGKGGTGSGSGGAGNGGAGGEGGGNSQASNGLNINPMTLPPMPQSGFSMGNNLPGFGAANGPAGLPGGAVNPVSISNNGVQPQGPSPESSGTVNPPNMKFSNMGTPTTPQALTFGSDSVAAQGANNQQGGTNNANPNLLGAGGAKPGESGDVPMVGVEKPNKPGNFDLVKEVGYGGEGGEANSSSSTGPGGAGEEIDPALKEALKNAVRPVSLAAGAPVDKVGNRGILGYIGLVRTVCASPSGARVGVCIKRPGLRPGPTIIPDAVATALTGTPVLAYTK